MSPSTPDFDNESVNLSGNPHLSDVLAVRLSRRVALKGAIGITTGVLLGGAARAAIKGGKRPARQRFAAWFFCGSQKQA
jgi:hypothetical protein